MTIRNIINKTADKSARAIASDISIVLHLVTITFATYWLLKVTDHSARFALAITWLISVEATLQNILQQRSINNTHDDLEVHHRKTHARRRHNASSKRP